MKKNVGGTESIVEVGAGSGAGLTSSFTLYEYTATANQTTFSGSDNNSNTLAYDTTSTPAKVLVYLNGVLLDDTGDYTATNGTSIVLQDAASAGDVLQVGAYKSNATVSSITLEDNQKIQFGDSNDLSIYHNGTDSVIENEQSGDLYIQNKVDDKDIIFRTDDGSGGFTQYFRLDGSDTNVRFEKNLRLSDSVNLQIGNSNDFQLNHNGTNTFMANNTGIFYITQNTDDANFLLRADDGSGGVANYVVLKGSTGEVLLNHYGNNRFKTTADGVNVMNGGLYFGGTQVITSSRSITNVTGASFTSGNRDLDIILADSPSTGNVGVQLRAGASDFIGLAGGGGTAVGLVVDSSNNVGIGETSIDANLHITHSNPNLKFEINGSGKWAIGMPAGQTYLAFDESNDALTTPTMVMTKTTKRVGIGETSPDHILHVKSTENVVAKFETTHTDGNSRIIFKPTDNGGWNIGANDNGNFTIYDVDGGSNTVTVEAGAGANMLVVDSNSRIGIGTASPAYKLDVVGKIKSSDRVLSNVYQSISSYGMAWKNSAGADNMFLSNGGDLGIGTTSPDSKLHIQSASATGAILNLETTHSGGIPIYNMKGAHSAQLRYQDENGNNQSRIDFLDGGDFNFIDATDGTSHMKISSAGNVGIGQSNPTVALEVIGDIKIKQGSGYSNYSLIDASEARLTFETYSNNTSVHPGDIIFKPAGTERMRVTDDGYVGIGTASPSKPLEVVGDIRSINSGGTQEFQLRSSQVISYGTDFVINAQSASRDVLIKTQNTTRMAILDSGYVGIGTASPTQNLHVVGNGYFSGGLTIGDSSADTFVTKGITHLATLGNNVGIGTTNPSGKLHVYDSGTDTYGTQPIAIFDYYDTDDTALRYSARIGDGATTFKTFVTSSATDFLIQDQDNQAGRLAFQVTGNAGSNQILAAESTGKVGIGTITPSATLHIVNNSTSLDSILLEATEATSTAAPIIAFKRNSSSVADADYLGQLKFKGENDADEEVVYAKITSKIQDASDGSEDGLIEFANRKAGSNVITARLRSDSLQLLNGTALTVAGDLTVNGTTTDLNTNLTVDGLTTLTSSDNATPLAIARGSASTDQAGISFNAGGNTRYIGKGTDDEPYWATSANLTAGSKIVTAANFTGILNSTYYQANDNISVGTISSGNITTTGYLRGPSTFTIDPATHGDNTGTVVIAGNLQVDGTTTTINSTTLTVNDKLIVVADGAADAAAANESGISVDGANAQILYKSTNDRWEFNKEAFTAFGFMIGTTSTDVGLMRNSSGVFDFQAQSGRQISFSNVTNGEHMRIDANGNVGIGTTSMTYPLEVHGSTTSSHRVRIVNAANGQSSVDLKTSQQETRLIANSGNAFYVYNQSQSTQPFTIKSNGNTGINTSSPGRRFTVQGGSGDNLPVRIIGGASTTQSSMEFTDPTTTADYKVVLGSKGDHLFLQAGGSERMRVLSAGQVAINAQTARTTGGTSQLTVAGSSVLLNIGSSNNDCLYVRRQATGEYAFQSYNSGNTGEIQLNPYGGNVAIGNTAPAHLLHVTGASGSIANIKVDNPDVGLRMSAYTNSHAELRVETNHALVFKTNGNNERMRLTADGRIGLSTTTPHAGTKMQICADDTSPSLNTTAIDDATLVLSNSDDDYGTVFGTLGTGVGLIQQRRTATETYYDLLLQPYGKAVGVRKTSVDSNFAMHIGSPGLLVDNFSGSNGLKVARGTELYTQILHDSANAFLDVGDVPHRFRVGGADVLTLDDSSNSRNVGINDTNPDRKVSIIGDSTSTGQYPLSLDATNTDYTLEFRRNGVSEWWIKQAGSSFNIHENGVGDHFRISAGGNIGIGNTSPSARLQIEEYGIDTTETSSTATTQIAIHTFAAATFRSARFTVQVTNSTDSTYHTTELLLVHDGTTANITEFGEIFTGSAAEATFDADISSGNVRLLATPASTDTMEFKVVAHTVTV